MIISHYAQNVTLSIMSHLVYITLLGETDGVTLSRLGCIVILMLFGVFFWVGYPNHTSLAMVGSRASQTFDKQISIVWV